MKDTGLALIVSAVVLGVVLLVGSFLIPWNSVSWGRVKMIPGESITVVGEAKSQQTSQIATFTAGVTGIGDNKDTVLADVNKKTQAIIDAAKAFGIAEADIKTRDMNVYQNEEQYYDESGRQRVRPGQWRVSNNVEVKLRAVDRAAQLTDTLSRAGATNMYGPSFGLDETGEAENALIDEAMTDAREKAALIARASGRKIKRVTGVVEGYQPQQIFARMEGGGGGGGGYEPGTGTVTKTLTVTFELQ